jgi:hypothetical protein
MTSIRNSKRRTALVRELEQLARRMLFGTLSETYRTCGQPSCRCHAGGPKHGPHLQVSFRGEDGKTTGYHVPRALEEPVRKGVAAWQRFLAVARQVAELNRERLWAAQARRRRP